MFFGYFLSVNELQVTHFDPGIFFLENIIFRTVSRNTTWNCHFWPYRSNIFFGGGLACEHLMAGDFCGRSGLPQLGVALVNQSIQQPINQSTNPAWPTLGLQWRQLAQCDHAAPGGGHPQGQQQGHLHLRCGAAPHMPGHVRLYFQVQSGNWDFFWSQAKII